MKKLRHKLIASVYLVLIKDEKILMGIRTNTGYNDGNYALVSGHTEADEALTHAMIRETKEEANIDLVPQDLVLSHIMHRKEEDERLDFFFTTKKWRGDIVNMEPLKCKGWEWVDSSLLPINTVDYVRKAIENIKNGILFEERGW